MKKRELVTKILAGLLVAVMLVGLLPMFASAEESDGTSTESQGELVLNKNAVLQADGTWTITLEAYATGTVQTEVRTQVTPTDIILVLDQSGSMTDSSYYINIGSGTYSVVGSDDLPTNEEMVSGTYYFWDANDQKYYPITTTRHIVHENSYWVYSDSIVYDSNGSIASYDTVCLASDPDVDNKVGTSWIAGSSTVNFDSGKGYLLGKYLKYQRSGSNRNYSYELIESLGVENPEQTPVTGATNNNNAYNSLVSHVNEKYQDMSVTSASVGWGNNRSYYAFAYVPVELVNADVYYYTYTYVDDMGQTWTIGHSEQDDGVGEVIANTQYDATNLGNIYTENTGRGPRLNALKNAATVFVNDMQAAAAAHKVDHRIAVVGFSGNDGSGNEQDDYKYVNSELFIGANQYNYYDAADGDPASAYYDQAFQSVNTTTGYNNLIASIGALEGYGPTYTSVGFNLATGIAAANAGDTNVYTSGARKLVVVFMTDGDPGWNGYEASEANSTVNLAKALETTYNATVYTVALLDSAPTDGGNIDNFLNNVTSDSVTGTGNNKYTLATDGVSLTNFFHSIEIEVDTTISTVTLSQNAFLVDRVSEYFNMPAGITTENMKNYVSIFTADHLGNNAFGTPVQVDYEIAASANRENELTADKVHAWLTYGATDNQVHGITVHNFDYLEDNMVTTIDDEPSGKKLIVVIKGITAKDGAALDYYIDTNNDHSGLWDLAENNTYGMLEAFPMPHTMVVNRIYVLDYAKDACLDTLDNTRNALALDSATDGVMSPVNINDEADKKLSTTDDNPAVLFGDAYIKTENGRSKVYYTPKTTNWYGYDTFYVFWQAGNEMDASGNVVWSEGDPNTGYGWSKVNVMPANNVYYEDTFVSTKVEGEYVDSTTQGTVGIEFGDGWSFTTVGEDAGTNTEIPESAEVPSNDIHGWVTTLENETGFTDGTVAVGDGNAKATATFTFTGTGMDLYSYTDKTTGTIIVKVKPIDVREGYTVPTRYFIVDNYAASGEYYSVPTVSYLARGTQVKDAEGNELAEPVEDVLVYGKYEVTITVTTAAAADGNRMTYYLDGIRVYNPLGSEQENNPTVGEGYGGEVHSFFYNIRDYLLSANDFDVQNQGNGAVFIDQIMQDQVDGEEAGVGVDTTVIQTYKDFGPKNEVYLAGVTNAVTTTDEEGNEVTTPASKGQMIVMKVEVVEGRHYFVSLKSPTGEPTTANVSHTDENKATINVNHTADLYYEVVPVNVTTDTETGKQYGYIAIENTGNALLSVTKYQITGLDPNPNDDIVTDSGDNAEPDVVLTAITGEEAVTFARSFSRMASVPYTGAGTSEENPSEDAQQPESPEIDIENPETETPDEPSFEDEIRELMEALVARLFKSVRDWFNY